MTDNLSIRILWGKIKHSLGYMAQNEYVLERNSPFFNEGDGKENPHQG